MEKGDETRENHDSWDESENNQPPPQQNIRPAMRQCNSFSSTATNMPHEISVETLNETKPPKRPISKNNITEVPCSGNYHLSTSQNFENCCLIQVAEGAFDDRLCFHVRCKHLQLAFYQLKFCNSLNFVPFFRHRPSFFHGSKNHFHIKEDNPKPAITDIADKYVFCSFILPTSWFSI